MSLFILYSLLLKGKVFPAFEMWWFLPIFFQFWEGSLLQFSEAQMLVCYAETRARAGSEIMICFAGDFAAGSGAWTKTRAQLWESAVSG